jgi:malonate decarboxylase gamma subunit
MTPVDLLASLFPAGHQLCTRAEGEPAEDDEHLLFATGTLTGGALVHVVGAVHGAPVGVDQALRLAAEVLAIAARDDGAPLLFLVDTASQRMSRRDELLGLSELLAHLAKSLRLADERGHRTIGLLYGGSAAGAFIATALTARAPRSAVRLARGAATRCLAGRRRR